MITQGRAFLFYANIRNFFLSATFKKYCSPLADFLKSVCINMCKNYKKPAIWPFKGWDSLCYIGLGQCPVVWLLPFQG